MNTRISSWHVFILRYKSSKELSKGCNSAISGFHCLEIQEESFHVVHTDILMHTHILIRACTHTEQKTRKHNCKETKYDISKAEGTELGNVKLCANRLCTHPFVKIDL